MKNNIIITRKNNKTQYFTKYGYVILYDNDVYLNMQLFKSRIYHNETTTLKLRKFIDSNRNILEIGTNCGTSSKQFFVVNIHKII